MDTSTVTPAVSEDFGAPVFLSEDPGAAGVAGGTAGDVTAAALDAPVIDLNDPNLLMADLDTHQEADPYAAPPPIPDGRWLANIKQRDVKDQQGQTVRYAVKLDRNQQPYAYTALDATVTDASGKFDKIALTDYFVSTRPDARKGGAIPLSWILGCLKVVLPPRVNIKSLLEEFFKALAPDPQIEIETVWEGSLDQADQERFEEAGERPPRVLGQHRFPKNAKGESIPEIDVDTKLGKVHLTARPRINGYYAVGSGKAAGIEYGPRAR